MPIFRQNVELLYGLDRYESPVHRRRKSDRNIVWPVLLSPLWVISQRRAVMSPRKERTFDPNTFLAPAGLGRTILQYPKKKVIFAQGEPCDAVFDIQDGRVKLTVLSTQVKEATIALVGPAVLMGQSSVPPDQSLRMSSA